MRYSSLPMHTTGFAVSGFDRLHIDCDRCSNRIFGKHFSCQGCENYDLCMGCVAQGLYCQDDTHSWMMRFERNGHRDDIDGPYTMSIWMKHKLGLYRSTKYASLMEATPGGLFQLEHRYIRKSNPREILIQTDGACSGNGQKYPQGGCCFVYRPSAFSQKGELTHGSTVSFPLENEGLTGKVYIPTSNRAELRAVVAALQFRDWSTDCNRSWRSIVIGTDSEYVAFGATKWVKTWEQSGWRLSAGGPVKNQDLWKLCLREIRRLQDLGVNVSFWRVPREMNTRADTFAKKAAAGDFGRADEFRVIVPSGNTKSKYIYRSFADL